MQQEFLIAATVMAMSLLAAAALILSFLPWKAHPVDPWLPYQKAQRVDPGIERAAPPSRSREAAHQHAKSLGASAEGELGHGSGKSVAPMYPHSENKLCSHDEQTSQFPADEDAI